jgi:hypothetical protein
MVGFENVRFIIILSLSGKSSSTGFLTRIPFTIHSHFGSAMLEFALHPSLSGESNGHFINDALWVELRAWARNGKFDKLPRLEKLSVEALGLLLSKAPSQVAVEQFEVIQGEYVTRTKVRHDAFPSCQSRW